MWKKSTGKWLLSIVLIMGLVLSGCGEPTVTDEPEPPQEIREDWPGSVTLGTALAGGVYFFYGSGVGSLIDEVVGIPVYIEQTGGPADNMRLVSEGILELGMVTMGIAYQGWHGQEDTAFEGEEQDQVRAMFPMYSTYSHWWAHKDDGISSIQDLDGKRIGVGPTGGTPGTYHPLILEALEINANPVWGSLSDLVESHLGEEIEANSFAAGIPISGLLSYEASVGSGNVEMLPIEGEERETIVDKFPYWEAATIPEESYGFLEEDLETISVFNWAICNKELPDDLVYQIVDTVMTQHDQMMDVHDCAEETIPENVDTNEFLPLHPGAAKWFEDNGYDIPSGAEPID